MIVSIIANNNAFSCGFFFFFKSSFLHFLIVAGGKCLPNTCWHVLATFILFIYCPFRGCCDVDMCSTYLVVSGRANNPVSFHRVQGSWGEGTVPEVRLKEATPVHKEALWGLEGTGAVLKAVCASVAVKWRRTPPAGQTVHSGGNTKDGLGKRTATPKARFGSRGLVQREGQGLQ